ncbi:MAG TPA: hypothetical protein VFJ72_02065 [Rubrobacteraceae bacterium]|nr:hypothetical protein [Rubrobacteraceae bacterium]
MRAVGYVDLRSRDRGERTRDRRKRAGLWRGIRTNPSILIAAGFAFGVAASSTVLIPASGGYEPLVLIVILIFLLLVSVGIWQVLRHEPEDARPKLGGEKQLLMAMRKAGGSITPVEAALETSLTVDEAEEVLSRFAGQGYLRVESVDGNLYYTLPGRHPGA